MTQVLTRVGGKALSERRVELNFKECTGFSLAHRIQNYFKMYKEEIERALLEKLYIIHSDWRGE